MDPIDIWKILLTSAFALGGATLRYLFMKVKDVVPRVDIDKMINDALAPQAVKQAMIYERLIHIEAKLDRLSDNLRYNSDRPNQPE